MEGTSVGLSIFFSLGFIAFVVWIAALADILRTPGDVWANSGQDRLVWVLVVVLLTAVGAVLYFFIGRPALTRSRRETFG